jgi:hypothetical protein
MIYINFAVNLARSFFLWHPDTAIEFQIITDAPDAFPADIRSLSKIIAIRPGELGVGFSSKLHLDQLAGEGQTLFIDSDCLIFGNLDFVFERFKGHSVSVIGTHLSKGEWFGDIEKICLQYHVPHLPKFNGGIYYLERGTVAGQVYAAARDLEKKYDELGFVRLRGRPNDEVLMALAMQLYGQTPVSDEGTVMSDPQACPGPYKINVISGERSLVNPPPPSPFHRGWYPFEKVAPVIVHFLGHHTEYYPYKREAYRLKKAAHNQLTFLTEFKALFAIQIPDQIKRTIKVWFRPVYRKLVGTRKIKQSERQI